MKFEEVVVNVEIPKSEEEADRTDGLYGGTLEASSLAEESHVRAKDEGKKNKKKKKGKKEFYMCRFCHKTFDKGQALGGHMNGHPEARNHEKMVHYEKLLQKMNSSPFRTVNPGEYVQETSSYPISNFNQPGEQLTFQSYERGDTTMTPLVWILYQYPKLPLYQYPKGNNMVSHMPPMQSTRFIQQSQQQMEPSQEWPMDPQQFSWPQASRNDINLRGGPTSDFTNMPNVPTTCAASSATINGNYGLPSMDPFMSGLTSQYSIPAPSCMSSNALYGNFAPCNCCNPLGSGPYQGPQMNIHSFHMQQGQNSSPTLNRNQPKLSMPSNMQINNFSSVQHAHSAPISGMGYQEMAVPQSTRLRPNPSDASDARTNHSPMFDQWSGNPTDHTF